MASRREYDMLFQLSAQMNGNFTGTFGKAQQQILQFQKEIQELNKTQSDVSAYEKQQQAVEGTKKKLETLQQQYDNIQREIQETGGFSADLENKLLSKQQQIDKTSASLERQTQKLDQMGTALREAGVDTGNLEKETERLGAEMADLKKKQEDAAEGAASFGKQTADAFGAAQAAITAAGIGIALKEIYEAYKQCITIAGDFEASMSNVEALSGASNDELRQLSDLAKELGATTKFTAKESADAMGYMAMAGWNAQQMLAGMPGVLQLAAASGEDLARVSDIVTDSMTAFGLTAADTSRYADVLAATAANANTSVGVMGETFKYAAPVAGALGYSIEDVSTAIGLMANAGIKGSNAGTALRNVFNGLLEGVTLTSDAFGDVQVSAVQADGTMADFGTTIAELRDHFAQMTDAERVNNAMVIAGQRGYAGLLSILNATDEDYAKLTASINNATGAAQRMADIKMDNMNGQLTLLNSAWEAVQTTIGEQFTPALADLYGWGAKVLADINAFIQKNPGLVKGIAAAAAVIALVVGAITAYTAAAKLAAIASAALTAAIPGLNIILGVTAGIAALVGVVIAFTDAQNSAEREVQALTATSREQYYQLQALKDEYDEVCAAQGEASADAQMLKRRLDEANEAFENSKTTAEEFAQTQRDLLEAHNDLMAAYADTTLDIDRNARSNANLMNRLLELVDVEAKTAAQKQEILTIVDMLNESLPELGLAYDANSDALNMTADAIRNVLRAEVDRERRSADREQLKKLLAEENDLYEAQAAAIAERNARQAEYDAAVAAQQARQASIAKELSKPGVDGRAYANAVAPFTNAVEIAREALEEATSVAAAATSAYDENQSAISDISASLAGYAEKENDASKGSLELAARIADTTEQVQLLAKEYSAAYDAALSSISGQYALWDEADKVIAISAGNINKALESQITYWHDYNSNLESLRARAADIEGLSDVIASFADGSSESVNAVAGMASATDEDLAAMVQNWRDLQQAQSETSDVIAEFKTDFTNQMDDLTQTLHDDIEKLDMSADAAESGRATIQAFIDAAIDMEPSVRTAYAELGRAAASAMSNASGASITIDGRGYAGGTNYAEPGLALVGELGPELMIMQGGEKILTAAETRELQKDYAEVMMFLPALFAQLRGYAIGTGNAAPGLAKVGEQGAEAILGAQFDLPRIDPENAISDMLAFGSNGRGYTITFAPVYNINGDISAADLENVLREHDEGLREQLIDLLEDIEANKTRSAYR